MQESKPVAAEIRRVITRGSYIPAHCLHKISTRRLCILRPGHAGAHLPLPDQFPRNGAA